MNEENNQQNCTGCEYSKRIDETDICVRFPPKPTIIVIVNQLTNEPEVTVQTAFPASVGRCGEYKTNNLTGDYLDVSRIIQ